MIKDDGCTLASEVLRPVDVTTSYMFSKVMIWDVGSNATCHPNNQRSKTQDPKRNFHRLCREAGDKGYRL